MLIDALRGFVPINMATGANNGDWVGFQSGKVLVVCFYKNAAGSGTEDPTITLLQAQDAAGTGSKALNVPAGKSFTKTGADLSAASFVDGVPSTNTLTIAASAQSQAIWVIELAPADLDIANGFSFVRAAVADVGITSQIGGLIYLYIPRRRVFIQHD